MAKPEEKRERIEALRGLMDRLCAPDLMLPEATLLRARLSVLLRDRDEPREPCPPPAHGVRPRTLATPPRRSEKGRHGPRSSLAVPCPHPCLSG